MKHFLLIFFLAVFGLGQAQVFSGTVFTRDNASVSLNQIFVTNLSTNKTVLCSFSGNFTIGAEEGDIVRFTSVATERTDLKISRKQLQNFNNIIELPLAYREIEAVIVKFKPTGILKKDAMRLKKTEAEQKMAIQERIGLPAPAKTDTRQMEKPIMPSPFALDVQSLYDVLSGDRRRQKNLYRYEAATKDISSIRNYYGDEYFEKQGIPVNLIENFLQFVYSSQEAGIYLKVNNMEAARPAIEKYLPVYKKRLENSNLQKIISANN